MNNPTNVHVAERLASENGGVLPVALASSVNPFSKSHYLHELKAYKALISSQNLVIDKGIRLEWMQSPQIVTEYFCDRIWCARPEFPVLSVDDTLWMSIAPMEVQSAHLAIERAHGRVVTGGLGLGYFIVKSAAKPEVTAIDVYERDARVIRFFELWIPEYPGKEKVRVINADMRKAMTGETYDFAFVDLYSNLGEAVALDDMKFFKRANLIAEYSFWGQEQALLSAIRIHKLSPRLLEDEKWFFEQAELEGGITDRGLHYPKWLAQGIIEGMGRDVADLATETE